MNSVKKYYLYLQNFSGEYLLSEEDNIGHYMIVETTNYYSHANSIMQNIIENYQEYCKCCGERWEMFESESKIFSSTDLDKLISLCYKISYSKPEYLYIFKMNGDIIKKVIE